MAVVEHVLKLKDDFTTVFDKFVEKTEQSERQLNKLDQSIGKLSKVSLPKLGQAFSAVMTGAIAVGSRFLQFAMQALDRAPDEIANSWEKLRTNYIDTIARLGVSALNGMTAGVERLNRAFESPSGQRLIKFLQVGFEAVGQLVGFVAERVAEFAEFLGDQITNAGDGFSDLFEFIGSGVGAIYVTLHNIIAAIWNAIASLAEFFMNVFDRPVETWYKLFQGVFNFIMDCLTTITRALDKIFDWGWTAELEKFRTNVNNEFEKHYGSDVITLDRMEQLDYDEYMTRFGAAGRNLGDRLSAASLESEQLQTLKGIEENTWAIKDAVTDEDLQMLIDMATQRFVSNVNLTAQTPVITVNGANTGNTDADRRAIARTIQEILEQLLASGSTTGYYGYAEA